MDKTTVIEKINDFLIDEFEVDADEIQPDANLKEALDLDSLDFVDLVVAVESNFGFKLVADDFVGVDTVQNFYDLINGKVNN